MGKESWSVRLVVSIICGVLLLSSLGSRAYSAQLQDPGSSSGALEQLRALCDQQVTDCASAATGLAVLSRTPFLAGLPGSAAPEIAVIDGESRPLIPYFLNLRDGDWLPDHVIEPYDSRIVAASLVRRLEKEENALAQNPDYDYYQDSKIQMAFWERLIEPIANGCFKNQHQTHTSGGMYDGYGRASLENRMIRVKLEPSYNDAPANPVDNIRPKYAYLGLQKPKPSLITRFDPIYGNIIAVFKDEVKDRTTFTPGDSLVVDASETRTLHYRSTIPLQLQAVYWEAQVWGELCVRDVDYFLVNCRNLSDVSTGAIERLKALHKPIYKCMVGQQDRFTWLYPGTPIYSPTN